MTQHELGKGVRVVPKYNLDTLGAPFKVTLIKSVKMVANGRSDGEVISIPDPCGLLKAVVRSRVVHSRKLGGEDIKFIRQSLDVRSKVMADFLEMTPEHFSRCESGARVMSSASEKHFRMAAFFATVLPNPEQLFTDNNTSFDEQKYIECKSGKDADFVRHVEKFIALFFRMKIDNVHKAEDQLEIKLCWKESKSSRYVPGEGNQDDGKWDTAAPMAA